MLAVKEIPVCLVKNDFVQTSFAIVSHLMNNQFTHPPGCCRVPAVPQRTLARVGCQKVWVYLRFWKHQYEEEESAVALTNGVFHERSREVDHHDTFMTSPSVTASAVCVRREREKKSCFIFLSSSYSRVSFVLYWEFGYEVLVVIVLTYHLKRPWQQHWNLLVYCLLVLGICIVMHKWHFYKIGAFTVY